MDKCPPIILVSACLLGQKVRFDGQSRPADLGCLINKGCLLLPICPECAGGLPIPRSPCEIEFSGNAKGVLDKQSRVLSVNGRDCSDQYRKGALHCLKTAQSVNASFALLKEKSPACGVCFIHCGNFDGQIREGRGVLAELLHQSGIQIFSENQIPQLMLAVEKS